MKHPGWTVKFPGKGKTGEDLFTSSCHGWDLSDADSAIVALTQTDAEDMLQSITKDWGEKAVEGAQVVEAWEVIIALQELEIKKLKAACKVKPEYIRNVRWELDSIKDKIESLIKDLEVDYG